MSLHVRTTPARLLAVASASLLLAACGSAGSTSVSPAFTGTAAAPTGPAAAAGLTLADGWVKAAPSGMTALFGTLTNAGDQPVTVVSAASSVAGRVELHEVVGGRMQPKQGGFTVAAHGTHVLGPGGDHVMLMGLMGPVVAGSTVTVTLTTSAGAVIPVTALVKDFAAGNESYSGASSGMSMPMSSPSSPGTVATGSASASA